MLQNTEFGQNLSFSSRDLVKHNFYINCNKISFNERTYHVFIL